MQSWRFAPIVLASLLFASVTGVSAAARADGAGPLPAPRVLVIAEGPEDAVLEQHSAEHDTWSKVCTLPCKATVAPTPRAQYRIVDGSDEYPVGLRGADGDRFVVRYSRGDESARSTLLTLGVVAGGAGALLLTIGFLRSLGQIGSGPGEACRYGDETCASRQAKVDDERSAAGTMTAAGGLTLLVGGAAVVSGLLLGRASMRTDKALAVGAEARANGDALPTRAPVWTGPSAAKPPPAHAQLVDVRF